MSCAITQGYNLDCRDSFGGVKEVYILEKANVTAITETEGSATEITKLTGKVFFKYSIEAFTGSGDQNLTANRANGTSMVKQTVKFPLNKMTVSVRNEILLLAKNRLLIVVVDNNGSGHLYGKDFGMMLTVADAKTGTALGDRNGFDLTFESEEKELGLFLDNTVIASLTVAGV